MELFFRTAIECQLLGARTVVVEEKTDFRFKIILVQHSMHFIYVVSQEQIPKKNRIIIYFLENRTAEHLSGYV
jgi:hypothetical protein